MNKRSPGEILNSHGFEALRSAWRAHQERLQAELDAIEGLEYRITCSACPFQLEGNIAGTPIYFRERWNEWKIGIGEDPVKVAFGSAPGFFMEGGFGPDDSYSAIIRNCIERCRAS